MIRIVSSASLLLLFFLCAVAAYGVAEDGGGQAPKRRLKILVNSPAIGWSHMQFQGRLADVLTDAGHEVHVLIQVTHPLLVNFTGVSRGQRVIRFEGPRDMLFDGSMTAWLRIQAEQCEELLANDELLAALEAEHYDVGLSECFMVCAFGLFHRVKVPTSVSSMALGLNSMMIHFFGMPTIPSWTLSVFNPSMNGPKMDFGERFVNFWHELYDYFFMRTRQTLLHQPYFDKAVGRDFPSLDAVMSNVSLVFVNGNEFFELPRPISNKVVYVGGIVGSEAGELSDRERSIVDNSESGVVLISFGTLADPAQMRLEMKRGFVEAFKQFPAYDFIWKCPVQPDEAHIFADAPNVHTLDWVHQKALLQHPKMRAFITHSGLNSINEAAIAGVPMIATPLFADQLYNAALVVVKGIGVHLDIREAVNAGSVVAALKEVLHNPLYANNTRLLARKLANAPFSPEEKLVKWLEFAADYPELNELNLPYAELNFFAYYSLDVIAASALIVMTTGGVVVGIVRKIAKQLLDHTSTDGGRGKFKIS